MAGAVNPYRLCQSLKHAYARALAAYLQQYALQDKGPFYEQIIQTAGQDAPN